MRVPLEQVALAPWLLLEQEKRMRVAPWLLSQG
jgi:hypothetical protein